MEEIEEQKPFACKWNGCGKSFTNEDHWSVHSKKHEMSLNLGLANRSSSFIDQTPTPTRLFKQWEEVGLFDELHENPFEETFRRAVESKSTPITTNSLNQVNPPTIPTNDDTLHTPQIFSHYNGTETTTTTTIKETNSRIFLSKKIDENNLKPNEDKLKFGIKREILDNSTKYLRTIPVSELIPKPPNIILVQKINPINVSISKSCNTKILPKIVPQIKPEEPQPKQISVKEKLKSMILKVPADDLTTNVKKKIVTDKPQLVKSPSVKFVRQVKDKNKEMDERNRLAARRYRDKKKIEQNHIFKLNSSLKLENSILKQKLKDFELAHRNCSVTVEQKPVIYLITNTKIPNS